MSKKPKSAWDYIHWKTTLACYITWRVVTEFEPRWIEWVLYPLFALGPDYLTVGFTPPY